jgi:hypothetical protein
MVVKGRYGKSPKFEGYIVYSSISRGSKSTKGKNGARQDYPPVHVCGSCVGILKNNLVHELDIRSTVRTQDGNNITSIPIL